MKYIVVFETEKPININKILPFPDDGNIKRGSYFMLNKNQEDTGDGSKEENNEAVDSLISLAEEERINS